MFGKPLTEPISKEEQFREVSKTLAIALHRIHKEARRRRCPPSPLDDNPRVADAVRSATDGGSDSTRSQADNGASIIHR